MTIIGRVVLQAMLAFAGMHVAQSVTISSAPTKHQRIQPNKDAALFTCDADGAINKCQFNIWDVFNGRELSLIDIDDRRTSDDRWANDTGDIFSVKSYNTSLPRGRCGITLRGIHHDSGVYVVSCRVRAKREAYRYRYSTLHVVPHYAGNSSSLRIQPEEAVFALPGTVVNVTCSTRSSGGCHVFTGIGRTLWRDERAGTCGASVNVTESGSGVVWCTAGYHHGTFFDIRGTAVVAYKPPSLAPTMQVTLVTSDHVETLDATCTVRESRPDANITWYWGDDVVDGAGIEEAVDDEGWRWSWQAANRTQILLKRSITATDCGKNVTCVATHAALRATMLRSTVPVCNVDGRSHSTNLLGALTSAGLVATLLACFAAWRLRKHCCRSNSRPACDLLISGVTVRPPRPAPRPDKLQETSDGLARTARVQSDHSYISVIETEEAGGHPGRRSYWGK